MTTLVDRLVEREIVRREGDGTDRRVSHIRLIIDLQVEPWSALTAFDQDFGRALAAHDDAESARFAEILDTLTEEASAEAP